MRCSTYRLFHAVFPNSAEHANHSRSSVSLAIEKLYQHTCGSARDASCQVCKTSSFVNPNRSLKPKSLPIRRLDIALPCCWNRATATVSVTGAIRAVTTVAVTATVAVISVVVDADVGAGVGVAVALDVCADDARYCCCCKIPGAGAGKADVDGR